MNTRVPLLLEGRWIDSETDQWLVNHNPATGGHIADVPCATRAEVDRAVAAAASAFTEWKTVPVPDRVRLLMRFLHLLKAHQDDLAQILSQETGKIFADAKGDVWRGIEVVEHACSLPTLLMGDSFENVARDIDTHTILQPLGVCAGITPFNFPAMIPLWMFPLAIGCGNTFVLKPSEQDPMTPVRIGELFLEAGFPDNVLQIVHGQHEQVEQILEHPDVRAVSFVGSAPVGRHVYQTGCRHLKRVQCMTGAKNHMVIMPDADRAQVIAHLVGASAGAAGQRCMAISVAIFVGSSRDWLDSLRQAMSEVRPGLWNETDAGFGPLINARARERVLALIEAGKQEGANCLLDGSDFMREDAPEGHWIGPTLFTDVTTDMRLYQEEIFGPVLLCMQVADLEEALQIVNACPYGNGTSIFTNSGGAARRYQHAVQVGQVGINIPIPVPLPFFSFTGWRGSFHGDQHAYGKQAVRFYTETKTIMSRWFHQGEEATGPNLTIGVR